MERITRAKAIRLKCLDCCCGNTAEVRRCPSEHCPLWRYRMGKEIKDETFDENSEHADEFEDEDLGQQLILPSLEKFKTSEHTT